MPHTRDLQTAVSAAVVERDDDIAAVLRALVAREHVLLVGPPGTGKSYLCRSVAAGIDGARYCERLLSPTTPPEAVWGPVSLSALREDRYEHATAGYAADAHILYLDEVGRASPAILDSLLHLLGPERQALIGTEQVRAPLVSAVGSANTWPEDAAMLDRWLIRRVVRPLSPAGLETLLWADLPTVSPVVALADLQSAHAASLALSVAPETREALARILAELADSGIRPSDRRCRAAVKVARADAVLADAAMVQPCHLECLRDVLWDAPEHADKAAEVVVRIANPVGAQVDALLAEADDTVQGAGETTDTRLAALQRLGEILGRAEQLAAGSANGRVGKAVAYIAAAQSRMGAVVLGVDPGKAAAILGAAR